MQASSETPRNYLAEYLEFYHQLQLRKEELKKLDFNGALDEGLIATFIQDITIRVYGLAIISDLYENLKHTTPELEDPTMLLSEVLHSLLFHCEGLIDNRALAHALLNVIHFILMSDNLPKNYSGELVVSLMNSTKLYLSQLKKEVMQAVLSLSMTSELKNRIQLLRGRALEVFVYLDKYNDTYFQDEVLDDLFDQCNAAHHSILSRLQTTPVVGSQFFSPASGKANADKKLIEATDYFFDFDDTLYDLEAEIIHAGDALLVRMTQRLGIRCHIATARRKEIEMASEWLVCERARRKTYKDRRRPNTAIHQVVEKSGLQDIFPEERILYCGLTGLRYDEEHKLYVILVGQPQKTTKIGDFHAYCNTNNINPAKAVIFDDKRSVWQGEGVEETIIHFVDNNNSQVSFFTALANCLAKVVLNNTKIDESLRKVIGAELCDLLVEKDPRLYMDDIVQLSEFTNVEAPNPVPGRSFGSTG